MAWLRTSSDMSDDEPTRPWCCPEPRCLPVHQLSDNADLSVPSPGDSFSCWGSLAEAVEFVYDGVDHANDLRSCHYSALKGLVMWQENRDDWMLLRDAYDEALRAAAGASRSGDQ